MIDLFTREAAVLRNVRNEAVVGYDGVVCDELGRLYLIMEYADGPSLKARLKDGPLSPDEVLVLRDRLAMGLGAAHEKGVIHRDMSPDNVILPGGRLEDAKIIDFGIAKLADPEVQTVLGSDFAGKYSYASPEQLGMYGGKVDARSDIYSAGLVLAAAAVGKPLPMGKSHIEVIEARRAVPDLSAVPEVLRDEIAWMLQPNPDDRPSSMAELIPALGAPATVRPTQVPADSLQGKSSGTGRVVGLAVGLVAVLAVGATVGFFVLREDPAPPDDIGKPDDDGIAVVDPPPPPPPPDPVFMREEIAKVIAQFQCSGLSATLNDNLDVVVTGFVSDETDLGRLVIGLSAVPGVEQVFEAVSIRPWPYCAAINVLDTQAGLEPGVPGKPAIRPNNADLVYYEGDNLVVRATATQMYDGYLYVDLIDKEGNVYHLFPSNRRSDNKVFAGQEITVGGGPAGHPADVVLPIGQPFGTDMIVAMSSPVPLYAEARPFQEPASEFLQTLSSALTDVTDSGHDPVASYVFITSREQ